MRKHMSSLFTPFYRCYIADGYYYASRKGTADGEVSSADDDSGTDME
jgi:hypothetical protein